MTCVALSAKNFVVTSAACQQKITFLMSPPLWKCVKILSIQNKEAAILKTHIRTKQVLQGPSLQRQNIRRQTHSATAKLQQEEQQPWIQTKELKVMDHTRRLEIFSLILLNSYCAANIINCYRNWRSITSGKHIQNIVQNDLLLSFDKDQPGKASFEFPKTKA